tara:strand:- start:84 stop:326 length:243 start_codon:yes stop_codon:yes gene_type:complete
MSPETVIYKLQRALQLQLENLTNVVTTGVDSMEKYRYILGQINALESVRQELSSLLNSEEKNEGTVIDIGEHKSKDNTTE